MCESRMNVDDQDCTGESSGVTSLENSVGVRELQLQPANNENRVNDEARVLFTSSDVNGSTAPPLPLPTMFHVKNHLFVQRDNLAHFTSIKSKDTSQTTEGLLGRIGSSIEQLQQYEVDVGNAMAFPHNKYSVFFLFFKTEPQDGFSPEHTKASLKSFKALLDSLDSKTFSILIDPDRFNPSEQNNILDLLKEIFNDPQYTITVCDRDVEIPPKPRRPRIIKEYHESVIGGHRGSFKLRQLLQERFYWPGMGKEIVEFIRSCPSCQTNKNYIPKIRQPMQITDTPRSAFEKIQIDIVGPLPVSSKGNQYLLTLQDNLTKYSDAIPLRNIDAATVAFALAEQFISRFGCPRAIHTDQGRNFISQIMKNFCKIFKIQRITSTAFHPQSLGSLERAHRVFINYLRHYCTKTDWDDWIRFCIFSYNTSTHEATGFTPHELVFGEKANIPSQFAKGHAPRTFAQHLDELFAKITTTQTTAVQNLEKAKQRSKGYYDQALKPYKFNVNDFVYLLREPKRSKFDCDWLGPYKINQMLNNLTAELTLGKNKFKIVHTNKLKLAHIRPDTPTDED